MIPLGWIRATPKNGVFMGVPQKNEYFRAKNEPWRPPRRPPCNVFNTKTLPLWYSVMTVTKSWMSSRKNWFGAKKLHFWAVLGLKIRFFLRYANLTPLFRLRRTRLNGIITSPCPEVTLDTFGFPVGARSAARRAVFWHRLPKMVLFGAKNAVFFGPKSIFLWCHPTILSLSWRDTKNARFLCWTCCTVGVGAAAKAHFWHENIHFFALHPYNPHFLGSYESDPMES